MSLQKLFGAAQQSMRAKPRRIPELELDHVFEHSADRIFDIVSAIEQHRRFLPTCKESRIITKAAGEAGPRIEAFYVLQSAKFDFRREGVAKFRIDRKKREITLNATLGGGELTAVNTVTEEPDGRSRLTSVVSFVPQRGLMRWMPTKPLIKRAFQRTMRALARRAEKLAAG